MYQSARVVQNNFMLIAGKIKEFNNKVDVSCQLSEGRIDDMMTMLEGRDATPDHLTTLLQILTWPHGKLSIIESYKSSHGHTVCYQLHVPDQQPRYGAFALFQGQEIHIQTWVESDQRPQIVSYRYLVYCLTYDVYIVQSKNLLPD